VVGDREAEADAVSVRLRSGEDLGAQPVADVVARILEESARRPPGYSLRKAPGLH